MRGPLREDTIQVLILKKKTTEEKVKKVNNVGEEIEEMETRDGGQILMGHCRHCGGELKEDTSK